MDAETSLLAKKRKLFRGNPNLFTSVLTSNKFTLCEDVSNSIFHLNVLERMDENKKEAVQQNQNISPGKHCQRQY